MKKVIAQVEPLSGGLLVLCPEFAIASFITWFNPGSF
jgi:hypothetical protein